MSAPKPSIYSFITINDPAETKSRSKKRQVRSAVAYYQHHKNDIEDAENSTRRRSWKRRDQSQSQSKPSVMLKHESSQSTVSSTSTAQTSPIEDRPEWIAEWNRSYRPDTTFRGSRVECFDSYPIPWNPVYEPILDFCKPYSFHDCSESTGHRNVVVTVQEKLTGARYHAYFNRYSSGI